MKILKIGIIGVCGIGNIHRKVIKETEQAKLVAVCDIDEAKLADAMKEHACSGYTDYKKMLKNESLDVVHICTPHYLHKEMIIETAKHSMHALCEKPVVMNGQEAQTVIQSITNVTVKVGIVYQNRFNPTIQKVWQYINNKKLGDLKAITARVYWQRLPEYYTESTWRGSYKTEGGGLLINQAIHTLDLIQWMGGEVDSVKGSIHTYQLNDVIEVEDTAEALLGFKNGVKGYFHGTNTYINNRAVEIEWEFDNGFLRLMNQTLYLHQEGSLKEISHDDKPVAGKGYYGNSHQMAIQTFYQAVVNDTNEYITVEEASKAIAIIDAIRK